MQAIPSTEANGNAGWGSKGKINRTVVLRPTDPRMSKFSLVAFLASHFRLNWADGHPILGKSDEVAGRQACMDPSQRRTHRQIAKGMD